MTTTPKDGGPAFPHLGLYQGADGNLHPTPTQYAGLNLRDWFAAHAPGLEEDASRITVEGLAGPAPKAFDVKSPENMLLWFKWWARADASARYLYADAMLKARETDND
jgi:hypothetical protein